MQQPQKRPHCRWAKTETPLEPNSAPIGIFDSGIGGLTVARALSDLMPHERICYFGDTARLPYGSKSADSIRRYSSECAHFLVDHQIKLLVVACHTASAYALDLLQQQLSIPVMGVVAPSIEAAVAMPASRHIAVLGTKATISSQIYQNGLRCYLPDTLVTAVACPLFVPLVEECLEDHPATYLIAREYLRPLALKGVDAAILGCTHYPLLQKAIRSELGATVRLIDPAIACAAAVHGYLAEQGLLAPPSPSLSHCFTVSDDPHKFCGAALRFLGQSLEVVQLFR